VKCNICRKHKAEHKDYRFIDSCGLQGKIFVCEWCLGLNDVAVSDIIRDKLNPKQFYTEGVQDDL
tara:strand:+ start:334 stop:528 length:195 start_codon:yes stop_codon:yes gene_type:complete